MPAPNRSTAASSNLDKVIQQNAASTEEMAATSEELTSQSDQLREMMRFFKVRSVSSNKTRYEQKAALDSVSNRRERLPHAFPAAKQEASPGADDRQIVGRESDSMDEEFEQY